MITNSRNFKSFSQTTTAENTLNRIQKLNSTEEFKVLKKNENVRELLEFGVENSKFAADIIKFLMGEYSLEKIKSKLPSEFAITAVVESLNNDEDKQEICNLCAKIFKSGTTIHDAKDKASLKISALQFFLYSDNAGQNNGYNQAYLKYFNDRSYYIEDNKIIHRYTLGSGANAETYTYIGATKNGRPHGEGSHHLDSDKKNIFTGTYVNGVPVKGTQTYSNGDSFIGTFDSQGKPIRGKLFFNATDTLKRKVFEGDFVRGVIRKGTLSYFNGDKFTGIFDVNGLPDSGTLDYAKHDSYNVGGRFTGSFMNGIPFMGNLTLLNFQGNDFYKGSLVNNQEGHANKVEFSGKFDGQGVPQKGELTFAHKRIHYSGKVNHLAQPDGAGILTYYPVDAKGKLDTNNAIIVNSSSFKNGVVAEDGILKKKGVDYAGKFNIQMQPHGDGIYTYSSSSGQNKINGRFENGEISGRATLNYASNNNLTGEFCLAESKVKGAKYVVDGYEYSGDFKVINSAKNLEQSKPLESGDILLEAKDSGELTVIYQKDQLINIKFPNKSEFKGTMEIVQGVTLLNGSLEDSNGTIYIGQFLRNGKPHGKCQILTIPESSINFPLIIIQEGKFINGERVGEFTTTSFKKSTNLGNELKKNKNELKKNQYSAKFVNDKLQEGTDILWNSVKKDLKMIERGDGRIVTKSECSVDDLCNMLQTSPEAHNLTMEACHNDTIKTFVDSLKTKQLS